MSTEIITAILALFGSLAGGFLSIVANSRLTIYRLNTLENNLKSALELVNEIPIIKEQIKQLEKRIADIERRRNNENNYR